jgi:hypothetical protein
LPAQLMKNVSIDMACSYDVTLRRELRSTERFNERAMRKACP